MCAYALNKNITLHWLDICESPPDSRKTIMRLSLTLLFTCVWKGRKFCIIQWILRADVTALYNTFFTQTNGWSPPAGTNTTNQNNKSQLCKPHQDIPYQGVTVWRCSLNGIVNIICSRNKFKFLGGRMKY